jgi:hypothetical protein
VGEEITDYEYTLDGLWMAVKGLELNLIFL